MDRCRVAGKIWATRKRPELENQSLILLARYIAGRIDPAQDFLVAVNTVHARVGETVVVAFGSGARNAIGNQELPVEAAVVGIVDTEVEEDVRR